jgi:hypothetical protein
MRFQVSLMHAPEAVTYFYIDHGASICRRRITSPRRDMAGNLPSPDLKTLRAFNGEESALGAKDVP